jgi:hypothetical protein
VATSRGPGQSGGDQIPDRDGTPCSLARGVLAPPQRVDAAPHDVGCISSADNLGAVCGGASLMVRLYGVATVKSALELASDLDTQGRDGYPLLLRRVMGTGAPKG